MFLVCWMSLLAAHQDKTDVKLLGSYSPRSKPMWLLCMQYAKAFVYFMWASLSVVYRAIRSIFKGNQEFYLTYQGSSALFFEQSRSKHPYGVPYDIGYFHNDLGSLTVRVRLAFCVTPFNVAVASGIRWHVMETQGVSETWQCHIGVWLPEQLIWATQVYMWIKKIIELLYIRRGAKVKFQPT